MTIFQKASSTTFLYCTHPFRANSARNRPAKRTMAGLPHPGSSDGILLLIRSMIVDPIKILIENKRTQKKPQPVRK